jgi:hypothetical protein
MAKNLFDRYIWLVDAIYRAGKITYEEINRKWLRTDWSEGKDLPLRTFHNHREAIQGMFDININCNKRNGNVYYIENKEDMERGGIRSWLLNTFSVNNLINESHHLNGRILFEEIPSGQRFLTPIIEAMRDNLSIEMNYQPFWHNEPITINIDPYCLKIFKQRWYVIGKSAYHHAVRTYSLDRIQEMRTTELSFKMPKTFNPESYFENRFGINKQDDIKPCIVKLKVFGKKRKYLQTLPLHYSQQEIETKEDYSVFSCYIAPTADFQTELLSHGSEIEVLSPEKLRADIADVVKKMNRLYE